MKKILVTGGAGYIGSFMVRELKEKGYEPVILDNLSQGHAEAVQGFRLEKIDLVEEKEKLSALLEAEKFDGVVHMASFIQMGESYQNPGKYYRNNVSGFLNLLDSMVASKTSNIILSSSAGVYGNPESLPIKEEDPKNPLNPYGETKYIMERMLEDYDAAYGIKFVSLRYFNASGAALDDSIGEAHPEESHLIPNVIKAAMADSEFTLFGEDYDTPDGTCVRDYVHVLDLVRAHTLALEALLGGSASNVFNLGLGRGYSNREVITEVEKVFTKKIKIKPAPKRAGDANELYASNDKITGLLNWHPEHDLASIVQSAAAWHKSHPNGYTSAS